MIHWRMVVFITSKLFYFIVGVTDFADLSQVNVNQIRDENYTLKFTPIAQNNHYFIMINKQRDRKLHY